MSVNNIGCTTNAGYQLPTTCIRQIAGIDELYLIPASSINESLYRYDGNDKIIFISYVGGNKFFKYEIMEETCSYEEKENEDAKTGTIFWNQNLTTLFHQNTSKLRKQLLQMIRTDGMVGIFRDNNERYWMVGKDNYLKVEASINTGQNFLDYNGQKLVINGVEAYAAYEVIGSAITYSTVYINGGRDTATNVIPSSQ